MYRGKERIAEKTLPSSFNPASFTAEFMAIIEALRFIKGLDDHGDALLFTDSQSSLAALAVGPTRASTPHVRDAWATS